MSKCCVICVGRNADRAADRIEAYAKKADFEIVETIFKDTKSDDENIAGSGILVLRLETYIRGK